MRTCIAVLCFMLGACRDVRVDRSDVDSENEGGAAADGTTPPAPDPRVPRSCDSGSPIVHEAFAEQDWPAAWLQGGAGQSWVEGHSGLLRADPGESHGRTLYAAFGDIDVAVRWRPSAEQAFQVELRGNVENQEGVAVEGHGVGALERSQWLRARIYSELGTTRLEVHEWFDGEREPEGWLRTVVKSAGPVGTFSLSASESGGPAPIRVEEVLICPLAVGTEV